MRPVPPATHPLVKALGSNEVLRLVEIHHGATMGALYARLTALYPLIKDNGHGGLGRGNRKVWDVGAFHRKGGSDYPW